MNIIYIVLGIVVLWSVWGYYSSRVESAEYTVVETKANYEIRLYPAHIVAQTVVSGPYDVALNQGFRIIAAYIFGANTKKQSIAMTSPVIEAPASATGKANNSQSIAMTTPVTATMEGQSHVIAFGMPKSYTMDTLPTPNDSRIQIVTIPEKKMAVMRFSWLRTTDRVDTKKAELIKSVSADGLQIASGPQYAGYNAPWTPPWMSRHEVMVEVK